MEEEEEGEKWIWGQIKKKPNTSLIKLFILLLMAFFSSFIFIVYYFLLAAHFFLGYLYWPLSSFVLVTLTFFFLFSYEQNLSFTRIYQRWKKKYYSSSFLLLSDGYAPVFSILFFCLLLSVVDWVVAFTSLKRIAFNNIICSLFYLCFSPFSFSIQSHYCYLYVFPLIHFPLLCYIIHSFRFYPKKR